MAPFIILQQQNHDYHEYVRGFGKNIFRQAEDQKECEPIRKQHELVAYWLEDIFKNEELRKGVTMESRHGNFFQCPMGETMSLAFKLKYMPKKATHAVFLMAPPDEITLKSKGKWNTGDPDTDPEYPGRISLGTNRVVRFMPRESRYEVAKDHRVWELYSAALTKGTQIDPRKKETELHVFPQWYPHGANPPAGATICYRWERRWKAELEAFNMPEPCNRDAAAQVMIFAATETRTSQLNNAGNGNKEAKASRPNCEEVLCGMVEDVGTCTVFNSRSGGRTK